MSALLSLPLSLGDFPLPAGIHYHGADESAHKFYEIPSMKEGKIVKEAVKDHEAMIAYTEKVSRLCAGGCL